MKALTLEAQTRKVHEARRRLAVARGICCNAPKSHGVWDMVDDAEDALHAEEDLLREMAVACFQATGNTQPGPGVSVREELVEVSGTKRRAPYAGTSNLHFVQHVTLAEDLGHALDRAEAR